MNFSFFKNISTIYFYFLSIICFVLANFLREKSSLAYGLLIFFGAVFFTIGILKKRAEN